MSAAEQRQYLGKQVEVLLAIDGDGSKVVARGQLLGFGEGGDFEILEDDGFVHYCWPALEMRERSNS